jgi:hypothetical protein
MDNDEEVEPIINFLDIEVWLEMLVDFFWLKFSWMIYFLIQC